MGGGELEERSRGSLEVRGARERVEREVEDLDGLCRRK